MNYQLVSDHIVRWILLDMEKSHVNGCVVGISGGIDSAVVSKLCALTNKPVMCVQMPINQKILPRAEKHIEWLEENHSKVTNKVVDLSVAFNTFDNGINTELALVNVRSRLRMVALYAFSNNKNYLVVGTGNKIEDSGIFFYTKFGDGGVDISPIGEFTKTEVYGMGAYLGIDKSILLARPSDDLWDDGRTDEDQIGATYPELEWAMEFCDDLNIHTMSQWNKHRNLFKLTDRLINILEIYLDRHEKGAHKMKMPRICPLELVME